MSCHVVGLRLSLAAALLVLGGTSCSTSGGGSRAADAGPGDSAGDPLVPIADEASGAGGSLGDGGGDKEPPLRTPPTCGPRLNRPWTVGHCATFELATWNIRNFPAAMETPRLVAQLVREMDLDLVAVQEIAHAAAFEEMLSLLPGYGGILSPHTYRSGEYQKTGFIFKEDHVVVDAVDSLFTFNSYVFPRPPLAAQFDVLLPGGQSARFLLVDVHLKAGVDAEDARRRRLAIDALKRYLDDFVASHPEGKAVVAGDFNDEVTDPIGEDVFQPLQAQGSGFTVLTRTLAEAGEYSFVTARSFIDQIIVTDSLRRDYRGGRTQVVLLDELVTAYDYVDDISDHLPVVASFPFLE